MGEVAVVFDKIPLKRDGGLVATYVNMVNELSDDYHIVFYSIFKSDPTDIPEFKTVEVKTLFPIEIDNRFYQMIDYARHGQVRQTLFAIWSAFWFFFLIPLSRLRTRRLLSGRKVVAVAPVPAMFISSRIRFLLEIHINFEYFWGDDPLGRIQSMLMTKPALTVFRNQTDAEKGKALFPSTFLYNTCDLGDCPPPFKHSDIKFRALFVGRLVDQKNPLMLLDITEAMLDIFPNFSLDIYGDGPLYDAIKKEIDARNLGTAVTLKGFTNNKCIYREYDLLWITSRFEGFGLVIIEAAANMVPTVSTNWGEAAQEIIRDGVTGYVANSPEEFVNDTVKLLDSVETRNIFAEAAYEDYCSRFSPEAHKRRWIEILDKL